MRNPLAAHPPWRQLLIVSVALPVAIVLAVLAFTWPTARIQPRDLPVGVVGATAATDRIVAHLDHGRPGGFDVRFYPNESDARSAIHARDIYGAFVVGDGRLEVLEAGAASPAVATLLTATGQQLASATPPTSADAVRLRVVDVVPPAEDDPKGLVLSAALLPLTICSIILAAAVGIVVRFRPAWRQLVAATAASAVAGAGAYLVGQEWLGAFPQHGFGDWAALALTILAMSVATTGLIALFGAAGLGGAAVLFVFLGNPFAGASSAPQLLPDAANHIGQWLPPGAGLSLLRSSVYFAGNGAGAPVAVLATWAVLGFLAIVVGHHSPIRFAASTPEVSKHALTADPLSSGAVM